ncbi:MAG: glycoside-pentoside-hexuronide (GPH):cation symporter, partial [Bifidobacterium dentium]|nr:glycoside-pentoside-hexuronide (GPH):cation symporter [Bifidobacterium dentium]
MEETLTVDKQGSNLKSRMAYAFGNVGQSAFYNALSTYFIVYVTSSLFAGVDKGIATKLIGIITSLVVIIRIAEIFIDPLLGNIIDNTNTKWGRFKPWQLIGGTVSALLLVVVYTGLFGLVNVNTTWFIVLFVVVFIVLDVFYSLRDISYWGMIPALSNDSHERSTYTALGSFGGSIGYNGLTIIVIPIVTYFSFVFTGNRTESQSGWTCFAIIVAILGILTVCSVAFGTKESSSTLRANAEENGGPLAAFKALAQNDQLLWVALSYLLYAIANVATTGVLMYLFKYILNNSNAYSIVGVIPVITGLIMAPAYPVLNKRIPRRYLYLGGMA